MLPAVYLSIMSKKLEILKQSLAKKEQELQRRFDEHFATVKQANGQPLNDKRNGQATLNKWEKQNNAIRTLKESIEKTKSDTLKTDDALIVAGATTLQSTLAVSSTVTGGTYNGQTISSTANFTGTLAVASNLLS